MRVAWNKGLKTFKTCLNCKSVFRAMKTINKFCNNKCMGEYYSKFRLRDKNPCWKGSKATMVSIHEYVRRHYPPPEECEICKGFETLSLYSKSRKHKRKRSDYLYLCRRCLYEKDGRYNNLKQY